MNFFDLAYGSIKKIPLIPKKRHYALGAKITKTISGDHPTETMARPIISRA
jgi:hypothetical protein